MTDGVGRGARPMVAYVVSEYPATSHTFIMREVRALRRRGVEVCTFSVRRTPKTSLRSPLDIAEAATTVNLLPTRMSTLVGAHARVLRASPAAWAATVAEALRAAPPGLRAKVWQLFYVAEAVLLFDACRRAGVRRLHAHLANVAADVAWLTARLGQRCEPGAGWQWSFTMHGPTEFADVSRFNLRRKVEAAEWVVCISDYCRSQLMRVVSKQHWPKLEVVRCGVDTSEFAPGKEHSRTEAVTVLSIGRLVPDKGHAVLLQALADARSAEPALRLVIAGDGPERRPLEAMAERAGVRDAVTFLGAVGQDGLVRLYEEADIFCLASFAEGLPIVLMEAMAMGLPVVTTSIAGIPELVGDGVSGVLVPPGNVAALAHALADLAGRPDMRAALGARGRAAVRARYELADNVAALAPVLVGDGVRIAADVVVDE